MPMNCEGEYGYLFMQELKLPPTHEKAQAAYKTFGERVHWVDGNNMPGSFQMNTCWWYKSNREQTLAHPDSPVGKPHFHSIRRFSASMAPTPTIPGTWAARWSSGSAASSTS